MIVPSIDLQDGHAVQLIGGATKALDAGDPRPLARRYGLVGEIAVVDLDAALGKGSNAAIMEDVIDLAPCRVGGGIRDVGSAISWLDRGALKVVLGTAARPEVLQELPRERVIAALDARHGEVVVEGWQKRTGHGVLERIAGGITTAEEVALLDRLGCDAQVGMALYTGKLGLAEAFAAPLNSDRPDGLWPTVVVDERGVALGLCYSDLKSLRAALERGRGVYQSRSRGVWVKGEISGATQELLRIDADCDRDCLRFMVRQQPPGFCHLNTRTCWGDESGLGALARRLAERRAAAPAGSYTARLFADPDLLGAKLREEASELAEAKARAEVIHEAADVLYFTLATLARHGVDLAEVERALARRALKVTRRD